MVSKKRILPIGATAKVSLAALALAGGFAAAAPATAAAAARRGDGVQASYSCVAQRVSDSRTDLYCTVYSGTVRMSASCSDGRVIAPIIGPGYSHVVFDCTPARLGPIRIDTSG